MLLMERGVHLAYASCLRLHCFPFIIAALRTLMRRPRPSICFSLSFSPLFLSFIFHGRASRVLAVHWVKCGYEHHYIYFVCIYFLSPHAHSYVFVPVGRFFFFSFFSLIFFPFPPFILLRPHVIRAEHDGTPSIYFRSSAVARPPSCYFFIAVKVRALRARAICSAHSG